MHDLAFADSARPSRVVCLRLLLQPYSIGHEILLWQARSPFLILSRGEFNELTPAQQIHALMRAVSICSRDWNENQKPEKWVRLWSWLIRNTDWPVAIADFRNYLESGRSLPPVLDSSSDDDKEAFQVANNQSLEGGGRSLGSPFLSQLILFSIASLKIAESEVYNFSFSLAGSLYYTHLENEGRLHIENHKEAQARREMAEHYAAIKAEREKEAEKQEEQCPVQ